MRQHGPLLGAVLLLSESELLKGVTDVLSGAGLPSTARAFGEILGWAVLLVLVRAVSYLRARFIPSLSIIQTVVAPVGPAVPVEVTPASITEPNTLQAEGSA